MTNHPLQFKICSFCAQMCQIQCDIASSLKAISDFRQYLTSTQVHFSFKNLKESCRHFSLLLNQTDNLGERNPYFILV